MIELDGKIFVWIIYSGINTLVNEVTFLSPSTTGFMN